MKNTMKELFNKVDISGLSESGNYISHYGSKKEFIEDNSIIENGETFEEVAERMNLEVDKMDNSFIIIDSQNHDTGYVYNEEDNIDDIINYLKDNDLKEYVK